MVWKPFFHAGETVAFYAIQSCDELDKENQEYHRDWIDRRIGDAGSGTVAHRVGGGKSRRTGHSSCNRPDQVQNMDLEYEIAEQDSHDHRYHCDRHTDSEQCPAAFLEC